MATETHRSEVWVVIPAFNEAAIIGEVIAYVRSAFEHVVCVDDGSRDGTGEAARRAGTHLVRHPIYSGFLVAGVGTAVALSWVWLIAVALAGVYFAYSATVEERYLTEQFPGTYPQYRRSTKMLVPFIL